MREKKRAVILPTFQEVQDNVVQVFSPRNKYDPKFSSTGSQQAWEEAGQSVPERQAKTHLRKVPFQSTDRPKGKQAAIRRVLSGTSVGTPDLDQRLFVTFAELLQTLKKGQSRFAAFLLYSLSSRSRAGVTGTSKAGDEAVKVSEKLPLFSRPQDPPGLGSAPEWRWLSAESPWSAHACHTLVLATPRLTINIIHVGVWGSAIDNTFLPCHRSQENGDKMTIRAHSTLLCIANLRFSDIALSASWRCAATCVEQVYRHHFPTLRWWLAFFNDKVFLIKIFTLIF